MRRLIASIALLMSSPLAQAETWELFNGTLKLDLPDGFSADYTPLNPDEVERTDLIRLVRPTSAEMIQSRIADTDLQPWQKTSILSDDHGEIIAVFEDFILDASEIEGRDGTLLRPLIEARTAQSWHEALTYIYTSYLGKEGVVSHFDAATGYGIVVVPELTQIIHVQQIEKRPLIIAGKNSLEAVLAYAKTETLDEAPDFSAYGMSDVEKEFDEACLLDVVRKAYASAEWVMADGL